MYNIYSMLYLHVQAVVGLLRCTHVSGDMAYRHVIVKLYD